MTALSVHDTVFKEGSSDEYTQNRVKIEYQDFLFSPHDLYAAPASWRSCTLFYAYAVPYYNTNHDLGDLSDWQSITYGHLGYIQYLYQYHHLPDFSPEFMGQYYHPPLFYIVGAIILQLFYHGTDNLNLINAFEMLQYVNMVFSVLISVFLYRILKQLKISEKLLCCLTALVSFFRPYFFWVRS